MQYLIEGVEAAWRAETRGDNEEAARSLEAVASAAAKLAAELRQEMAQKAGPAAG